MTKTPTVEQGEAYDYIYSILNTTLFNNDLPQCIFTINSNAGDNGCFIPDKYEKEGEVVSEIQFNPLVFGGSVVDFCAVICRQMVSVWQHYCGKKKPYRTDYCNQEWANKMKEVGLTPVGEIPSFNVEHEIDKKGRFLQMALGIQDKKDIPWKSKQKNETVKKSGGTRAKYTCSECGLNLWGKGGRKVICGDCNELMTITKE